MMKTVGDMRAEFILRQAFRDVIVDITEYELAVIPNNRGTMRHIIRRIVNATETEITRPLREVLNMNGMAKE